MLETIRKLFRHQKKPVKIWRPGRGYTVEVVGESHYQTELYRITGGKTWDGHNLECQAVLVVNEHGWDGEPAVLVRIKGHQVGHLSRTSVAEYLSAVDALDIRGEPIGCAAKIVGGWERDYPEEVGGMETGSFGVKLKMSWPPKLKS